jgi:NarL family two-component system sensor histidine kinase LiaS
VHLELQPDGLLLKQNLRMALFRIYQQSLSNVLRHARAKRVLVRFQYDAEKAYLEIQDDGKGFEVPESWVDLVRQGHMGLAGSAERAGAIGGNYRIVSSPGIGSTVQVAVPLVNSQ